MVPLVVKLGGAQATVYLVVPLWQESPTSFTVSKCSMSMKYFPEFVRKRGYVGMEIGDLLLEDPWQVVESVTV